ncbi:alpha-L-fucosidase [Luteipulveratus mongoliensis]|uniref:alpha-L-fucosidase n=1 Tax=Luteipulveratus mongoliensis TaxID=571913 RepID=A0A0K1JFZ0_9MICO|nr:alpha-L-fucosidase [Luteipulveratus mongoliensis]AKU15637.1 alpha-L-fucosidase [Luteipulveratus mongoliensis]
MSESPADTEWFTHDRFGMFIHWGAYALAARHEWVRAYERLTDEEYQHYVDHFDPDLFDPVQWADEAWNAGMRYVVVTTKHHDGFCLWDSAEGDYTVASTPWGNDLIGPIVEAFRARGMKIGLYYSLLDWHHPEFPLDLYHPEGKDEAAVAAATDRDMTKYTEYLHAQVRELLTRYGKIDLMWFDFSYEGRGFGAKGPKEWQSERLVEMARELQPEILINNRLGLGSGDFTTPEQVQPPGHQLDGEAAAPWEACQTLNGSWGYHRDNLDWKSSELMLRMLVDGVSKGGNMILNVGPNGRGDFEPRAVERLREIGAWMRLNERSVRGCGPSEYVPPVDARYTQNGNRLYLHLFSWPMRFVHLPGLGGRIQYAQLLHDASEVRQMVIDPHEPAHIYLRGLPADTATLQLPVTPPDITNPVIEIFLAD